MILYLDTSSLVKLHIAKDGSEAVRAEVAAATLVATSVVAFPEAYSVFARLVRGGFLTSQQHQAVREAFRRDWDALVKVPVRREVYLEAGRFAEAYALRGFDALHLASFARLLTFATADELHRSAFDARLAAAAGAFLSEHRRDE